MKPRVLIFIDWFAPGFKAGGPTTSNVNIVDHLSRWFDFYVITSDTDYHAVVQYPDIKPDCWLDRGNCHVWYCSKRGTNPKGFRQAIEEARCDVWYINGIYSHNFSIIPLLLARNLKPIKLIVSPRGMLSPQTFTVKPFRKRLFLLGMRMFGLYSGVLFHGTNDFECECVRRRIYRRAGCFAIENLPRRLDHPFSPSTKSPGIIRLVSFARISPEKNTLYALEALQLCKADVRYHIYGQVNSEQYWQRCRQMIDSLPENVKVEYKGTVNPAEMSSLYMDYDALYLPTTGENFGHAILESFMNSRPVIISDTTPWRSLEDKNIGFDLSLVSPEKFASTIDSLAQASLDCFLGLCQSSYNFAKKICNNTDTISKYKELFSL